MVVFYRLTLGVPVPPSLALSFARLQATRMGNFYSHNLRVAMVTNANPYQLGLDLPSLQWEENGFVVTASAVMWCERIMVLCWPPVG
jgi:hypothetical protein